MGKYHRRCKRCIFAPILHRGWKACRLVGNKQEKNKDWWASELGALVSLSPALVSWETWTNNTSWWMRWLIKCGQWQKSWILGKTGTRPSSFCYTTLLPWDSKRPRRRSSRKGKPHLNSWQESWMWCVHRPQKAMYIFQISIPKCIFPKFFCEVFIVLVSSLLSGLVLIILVLKWNYCV